jgi:hypothetical protein
MYSAHLAAESNRNKSNQLYKPMIAEPHKTENKGEEGRKSTFLEKD